MCGQETVKAYLVGKMFVLTGRVVLCFIQASLGAAQLRWVNICFVNLFFIIFYFMQVKSVKTGSVFWAACTSLSYFYMVSKILNKHFVHEEKGFMYFSL